MKQNFVLGLVFFSSIVSVFYLISTVTNRNRFHDEATSELVSTAKTMYPLDGKNKYIVKKNSAVVEQDGAVRIPENIYYVLTVPGEEQPEIQEQNSGRIIGSTAVNLDTYEGQSVTVYGYHYQGSPMFLQPEYNLPMFIRSKDQAVVHIYDIKSDADIKMLEEVRESLPTPSSE